MRKSALILSAALLALTASGPMVASASSTSAATAPTVATTVTVKAAVAKPKAYGFCAHRRTGEVRMLEPLRLKKSQHGKCKASERKFKLPTAEAIPAPFTLPSKLRLQVGTQVSVCALVAPVDGVPGYSCPLPPAPTPSPSPSATPTS